MTPLLRTVTSGLKAQFIGSGTSLNPNQLKTRTLYGQLLAQYRVPTHRL